MTRRTNDEEWKRESREVVGCWCWWASGEESGRENGNGGALLHPPPLRMSRSPIRLERWWKNDGRAMEERWKSGGSAWKCMEERSGCMKK